MATYNDRFGIPWEITHGELNDEANHLLMSGQCHALAIAVHELTGWDMVLIEGYDLETDELLAQHHVAVAVPDHGFGDADGIHDEDFMLDAYGDDLEYSKLVHWDNQEELLDHLRKGKFSWKEPEMEMARSMLGELFKSWNIEFPKPQLKEFKQDLQDQAIDSSQPALDL